MKQIKAISLVGAVILAAILAACSDSKNNKAQAKRPVPVTVDKAESGTIPVSIQAVGNVEPCRSVAVKTQVGGLIVEQRVRDGQEVAAGDVLFVLDQRPFQAALKDAEGKLERDRALLKRADDDLARYTGLSRKDVISQQQYDQANTDAKSLRASIKLSEAAIDQAKLQLDYSVIKAPFAGRVGSILVNQGNVIKANDDRNLLVLNQIQPIYVTFAVPEQYLPEISSYLGKSNMEVLASLAGDDAHPEKGELAAVDNAVDRTTGTIKLKGLFRNENKRLWPGQFTKVVLNLANRENVLTVPSSAVQQGLQGSFLYVATPENTASLRMVETGGVSGDRTIITKGVSAGETVITDGQVRLVADSPIEIKGGQSPGGKNP